MGQAERDAAIELCAVAPLVADGATIGPVTLVSSGDQVIGFTTMELLRGRDAATLSIGTTPDAATTIPIRQWSMGRYTGIGLVELAAPLPADCAIKPIPIAAICATIDTRGAPAALVTIAHGKRVVVPVNVDAIGGMDVIARLATPLAPLAAGVVIDGAPLFAWFPPERALGRPAATLAMAVAYPYRAQTFTPRDVPAVAELVGLDDLGRAMSWTKDPDRADPPVVTGEFEDHEMPEKPLD